MKFISLNLEAKNKNEMLVKNYLEEHASEVLADKINSGVQITVTDDAGEHTVINKKTLSGFWAYASAEARKQATGNCAAIEDEVVFGWAVHYFEEESIEGDLYNLDGTRFTKKTKPPKTETKPKKAADKPATKPAKDNGQMSLFDALAGGSEKNPDADEAEGKEELEEDEESGVEDDDNK